jgi:monofunctional biosynthetic peptidoglycan transglycosylase
MSRGRSRPQLAPPPPPPHRGRSRLGRILKWLLILAVVFPVGWTVLYRFVPPPTTYLMLQRAALDRESHDYRWRSLDRISPHLVRAVIASEDARFCSHQGFDVDAIQGALKNNERRPNRMRGGSTISQQTAKNAFLWPQRSYVRKAVEAYFTLLIETLWNKRRIMETYLNIVEWGPGVYGAQAAARHWFGKDADKLTQLEAARLAAILPSPRRYRAAAPGPYVRGRTRAIQARMGVIQRDGYAACVLAR